MKQPQKAAVFIFNYFVWLVEEEEVAHLMTSSQEVAGAEVAEGRIFSRKPHGSPSILSLQSSPFSCLL